MKPTFLLPTKTSTLQLVLSLSFCLEICIKSVFTATISTSQTDSIWHLSIIFLVFLFNYLVCVFFLCFFGESSAKRAWRFRKGDLELGGKFLKKLLTVIILLKEAIPATSVLKRIDRRYKSGLLKSDLFFRYGWWQSITKLRLFQRRWTFSMRIRSINEIKINGRGRYGRIHYLSNIIINGKCIPTHIENWDIWTFFFKRKGTFYGRSWENERMKGRTFAF